MRNQSSARELQKASKSARNVYIAFVIVTLIVSYVIKWPDAIAAEAPTNTPIHLSGNEQGQGVLVFINPWGQVVVQLRDTRGHVTLEEYTPLQVDSYTTSVLVDVCGDDVYLVESGEGLVYYHLALPGARFDCCEDEFTLWLPGVAR